MKIKQQRSVWYKSFSAATSVDEDSNKVSGYLAAFNNIDSDRDILIKGAFAKSITERGPGSATARKIAFLYMHDMKIPVGRFTKLEEMELGLYYEGELDLIPFAQETIKPQLKSGTLNQHSIGYNYIYDKLSYDEAQDAFIVKEVNLFEGSIVTLGANENTPFGGFKNYLDHTDDYQEMALTADRILKKMGNYEAELELRTIIQKYQSLLDYAAEEVTAMKSKPKVADYKYMIDNFKL